LGKPRNNLRERRQFVRKTPAKGRKRVEQWRKGGFRGEIRGKNFGRGSAGPGTDTVS